MAHINEIIKGGITEVQKLMSTLSDVEKTDVEADSAASLIEEYEGDRTRRATSVHSIQKDYQIGEGDAKETVKVKKYVFPFPKKIVRFATVMLFGGEMTFECDKDDKKFQDFKTVWSTTLRMKSLLKKFTRTVKIQKKAALLFYGVRVSEWKFLGLTLVAKNIIKAKLLDTTMGDFEPHFDDTGDMDAFLFSHSIKEEVKVDDTIEEQTVRVFDIYTAINRYRYRQTDTGWEETPQIEKHHFTKIPAVYFSQKYAEWEDVANLIDGYEVRLSKLGDSNDYTGDPIIVTKGEVELPKKNRVGKVIEFKSQEDDDGKLVFGDAKYLTHDQLPQSVELELRKLKLGIEDGTSTPDISFEAMKGIGNMASASVELMFLDPLLKAEDSREDYDVIVSRCVSIVKNGMANIVSISSYNGLDDYNITVKFKSPLPKNLKEYIEMLGDSVENKIMSRKTATQLHPSVKDSSKEYDQIQLEIKEEQQNSNSVFETFQ